VKVAALSGGVGGAKLALGLNTVMGSDDLTLIANTGDDFEFHGLHVSPDIDTLVYTLSGKSDEVRGWGLAGETWGFMEALGELGGEDWFNLGDHDLAMHILRTEKLRQGISLSAITADVRQALGIAAHILPMSDQAVPTIVHTVEHGPISFQRYFVERRAEPAVTGFTFEGIDAARPAPGLLDALAAADRIIICPSNPFISIDPVLAVPGVRDALAKASAPVIAVSPIVAGDAIKGPTAKIFREMGTEPSVQAVAARYQDIVDLMIIDEQDAAAAKDVQALGLGVVTAQTVMRTLEDKIALAETALRSPVPPS
jgi:LPPG:FO 2-phospho-L-lactate transferase